MLSHSVVIDMILVGNKRCVLVNRFRISTVVVLRKEEELEDAVLEGTLEM